ncbi:hypothetical protein [Mangrovivirga cuniculi]|nr:hypothetical protein [Mangrovivirga cuniculi]
MKATLYSTSSTFGGASQTRSPVIGSRENSGGAVPSSLSGIVPFG